MSKGIDTENNFSISDERDVKRSDIKKNLSVFERSEISSNKDISNDQSISQLVKVASEMGIPTEFVNFVVNTYINNHKKFGEIAMERDSLKEDNTILINSFKTLLGKYKATKIELKIVKELSETDVLTGIYNRRGILKRLSEEIKSAHRSENPLVLLLIDGDNFKYYNETFNYDIGDQVLKHIINTAKSQIRPKDILGRLGGEEFILILPQTKLEDSLKVAERVRKAINSDFTCNFKGNVQILKPSVSIGVASKKVVEPIVNHSEVELFAKKMIEQANITLKEAKSTGKNKIVVVE